MPLGWTRSDEFGIVTVVGQGDVSRQDIEGYLAASEREGTRFCGKLVDASVGNLSLDRDDLISVARTLVDYSEEVDAGPVALVVQGALNIDMAVLLKQRVGARPFRIFTDALDARDWLMTAVPALPLPARPLLQLASAAR